MGPRARLILLYALIVVAAAAQSALAQTPPAISRCLAIADTLSPLMQVAYRPSATGGRVAQLGPQEVKISYVGHSTYLIESAAGIRIATDYNGYAGLGALPQVVTMNHAHESHFTDFPDPEIPHVLRGWNPDGGYADHALTVGDVYIRNVPTNIRTWAGGGTERYGNSIFIFEVANLCIGHLGHLHHELNNEQLGQIGHLDIVMVPVDGSYTLDLPGMINVMKELRARLILPMHYFSGASLARFIDGLRGENWASRIYHSNTIVLSQDAMPQTPEILVLPPSR